MFEGELRRLLFANLRSLPHLFFILFGIIIEDLSWSLTYPLELTSSAFKLLIISENDINDS